MRSIKLSHQMPGQSQVDWLSAAVREIESASQEGIEIVFDAIAVTDGVVQRDFNPETATVRDVARVLATLIIDAQKRGPTRS